MPAIIETASRRYNNAPTRLGIAARAGRSVDRAPLSSRPFGPIRHDQQTHFLMSGTSSVRTLNDFTVIYTGNPLKGYIDSIVNYMGGDSDVLISTVVEPSDEAEEGR